MLEKKCIYFGKCGGCQLQGLTMENYCQQKTETLKEILKDIPYQKLNPIITFPSSIRRKATFKIDYGCNIGFYKEKSNDVVAITKCPQFLDEINALILPLRKLFHTFVKRNEGNIIITKVANGITLHFEHINIMLLDKQKIKEFAELHNILRITTDTEELYKKEEPVISFNNIKIPFPAKTFLQPSENSEAKIVELVLNELKDKHYKSTADIFCGLGLFSFYLKDYSENVFATDCNDLAIKQLTRIAHSHHFNIETKTLDLFKHPISAEKLNNFDFVVIDPPRDGAFKQCKELANSNVKEIIYVSCNPLAFVKDVKILLDGNYTLTEITPIDQFQNTKHLELVAILKKN